MFNNGLLVYGLSTGPGGPVTGSGTANTVPLWTSASVIANSVITQNVAATLVTIAAALAVTTGGLARLTVNAGTSSGTTNSFLFSPPAHTATTASVEVNNYVFTGGTRQWETGAITTQRNSYFTGPTLSFVGASTVTDAYTVYIDEPTAGTNATITNSWALGLNGGIKMTGGVFSIDVSGSGTTGYIYSDATYSELSAYAATGRVYLASGTSNAASIDLDYTTYSVSFSSCKSISSTSPDFTFTGKAHTTITASTEKYSLYLNFGQTVQHATGALTTQRAVSLVSPTYSFVGASTISEAYAFYAVAPTAGANATITNNFALGLEAGTATLKMGNLTGDSTIPAIYANQTTPSSSNFALRFSSTATVINASSDSVYVMVGNVTKARFTASATTISPAAVSSGAITAFTFTGAANTGQTASTEINGILFTTTSRQWATGAITTQREFYITAPTYSFVGASTITNAYAFYAAAPTAGTNATITNSWAAGFEGDVSMTLGGGSSPTIFFKSAVGAATLWAIYANQPSPSASNYALRGDVNSTYVNSPSGALLLLTNGTTRLSIGNNASSGAVKQFSLSYATYINQTLSTEISGVLWTLGSRQWATGAITTQREFLITAPTYSFVGASTITTAATFAIAGAPVAGTNATITTALALWVQAGDTRLDGGLIFGEKTIDTTAGDSATINAPIGRFRKDTSGSTFTLTNSYITANSIVLLTLVTAGITTGYQLSVVAGAGSAVITFETAGVAAAPSANCDVNFEVFN